MAPPTRISPTTDNGIPANPRPSPYVFATVDQLKRELRRDGRDVIDLGFGNPDIPSPQIAVEKLAEAALRADQPPLLGEPRPAEPAAGGLRALREASSASQLDPDAARRLHDRREGRPLAPDVGAARGGRQRRRAEPRATRSISSRRASPARRSSTRGSRTATCSPGIEEALDAAEPAPRVVIASFPHNPTTAIATPELMQRLVDLAREHEFILVHDFAYADVAFDGHVPPSVLAGRRRARLRGRALLADEVLLDGRLARRASRSAAPTSSPRSRSSSRYLDYGTFQPIQIASIVALREAADYPAEVCEIYRGRRDALMLRPRPRRLARRAAEGDDVRLGADPRAVRRARLARVRAQAGARGRRRGQPRHRLRRRAATVTSASPSSRTSSGSTRRRARSAGCSQGSRLKRSPPLPRRS